MNQEKVKKLAIKAGFSHTYEIERLSRLVELVVEEIDILLTESQIDTRYENVEFTSDLRKKLRKHFFG